MHIGAHEDMLPTLLAAVGEPSVKEELLRGRQVGDKTFKVHVDGYNLLPARKGEAECLGTISSTGPTTTASPRRVTTIGKSPS